MPFGPARECGAHLLTAQDALDHAALSLREAPGTENVRHLQYLGRLAGEATAKASALHAEVWARLLAVAP